MPMTRRSFALTLSLTPGIGGKSLARILARNDLLGRTPEEFFKLSAAAYKEEYRLLARAATNLLKTREELHILRALERRLEGLGVELVVATDASFPYQVEMFDPDPPAALFLYGNKKLLDRKTFAVLSSKNARPAELDQMEQLTEQRVLAGEILVSGHDRPEYQRTAVVPLRWGSPRILCLDRGMFQVLGDDLRNEAFRLARLWRYEFDPSTDLVVSPFRPDAGFAGVNNQVRDRLVASLANRIDFVKIDPGGNMQKILNMAIKAARPVRVSDRIPEFRTYRSLGAEVIEEP